MKKAILLLLILIASTTIGRSQALTHLPGAFLDVGIDAQSMGMGGARVALSRDISALLWNPAALLSVRQQQVLLGTTRQFGLVPYHLVCYGGRFWDHPFALGVITAGDEVMRENTILLGVAHRLRGVLSIGVSLKVYQATFGRNEGGQWIAQNADRQVQGDAFGFGIDIGARGLLTSRMIFGISVKDFLSSVKFNANNQAQTARGGSENVPTRLRFGLGMMLSTSTTLEIDLDKALHLDVSDRFVFGLEHTFFGLLMLRGGYAQNLRASQPNRIVSVGAGIGLTLPRTDVDLGLDAAYQFTELQNFPQISLRMGW